MPAPVRACRLGHSTGLTAGFAAGVAFTPDGQSVAAGVPGVGLVFWNAATGQRGRTLAGDYHSGFGFDGSPVVFDGRGTRAAVSMDDKLGLYAPRTGELRQSIRASTSPSRMATRPLALSGDGKTLLLVRNSELRLVDAATGKLVRNLPVGRLGSAQVAFSPDGSELVSVGRDKLVRLFDVATGVERREFRGHIGPPYAVAFSPDGKRLLTGGVGGLAFLWDVMPKNGRGNATAVNP